MKLKETLKTRVAPIILGASISTSVMVATPVFVDAQDIETSIVVEEDEPKNEIEQHHVNEDYLEKTKPAEDSNIGLYSIMLIGSTIGLVGVKNKLKKKKMK